MPTTRKGNGPRQEAASSPNTTKDKSTGCTDNTAALDLTLVGPNVDIWAKLFNGEFRLAVRCDVCGRWLTAGASKVAGRGPNCAARAVK